MYKKNIFHTLGIYGKENIISNFFAWLLNPSEDHDLGDRFLCELLKHIDLNINPDLYNIKIIREFYGEYKDKSNYIDIVILMRNQFEEVEYVIGIENKVFSDEGFEQTDRYWKLLKNIYPKADTTCVFLTKKNYPVKLSNEMFTHIKYKNFSGFFKENSTKNELIKSFYNAYILNVLETDQFKEAKALSFREISNHPRSKKYSERICQSIAEKFNDESQDKFARHNYSARGGYSFYQIWKNEWFYKIEGEIFNIHLEGDYKNVKVHFETYPYKPYSGLRSDVKEVFSSYRDKIREFFTSDATILESSIRRNVRKNAVLTIANYDIVCDNFDDLFMLLSNLVEIIDQVTTKKHFPIA